jgi:hypothetical protein
LLVKEDPDFEIKHIKNIDKVMVLSADSSQYDKFLECIDRYSAVISHGLFYRWQEKILLSVSDKVKVAWVFWGAEIYGRSDFGSTYFAPKTKMLYWSKKLKRILKSTYRNNKSFFANYGSYKHIHYCLTDVHEEFEFVKNYTQSTMKELWYNYYSIEETLGELQHTSLSGTNILVGNSCTLENNHLDTFKILNNFDLGDRKLIVPLSYGENWVRKILLKKGRKMFGNSFFPLLDFMERDNYNRHLTSCSIVVMNHYRQQALGNIITSLWLGAKVYLNKKSCLYTYLLRLGIQVLSIEDDLVPSNKSALEPLNSHKVEKNREILMREYGRDAMQDKINKLVKALNN